MYDPATIEINDNNELELFIGRGNLSQSEDISLLPKGLYVTRSISPEFRYEILSATLGSKFIASKQHDQSPGKILGWCTPHTRLTSKLFSRIISEFTGIYIVDSEYLIEKIDFWFVLNYVGERYDIEFRDRKSNEVFLFENALVHRYLPDACGTCITSFIHNDDGINYSIGHESDDGDAELWINSVCHSGYLNMKKRQNEDTN